MFDLFEVAVGFVDHFIECECVVIVSKDFLEIHQLVLVYHAQQHGFFCVGVCTQCIELRGTMPQLLRQ